MGGWRWGCNFREAGTVALGAIGLLFGRGIGVGSLLGLVFGEGRFSVSYFSGYQGPGRWKSID